MRKRKESWMTQRFFNLTDRAMEVPSTEMEKLVA